jgi:hypothetical protein
MIIAAMVVSATAAQSCPVAPDPGWYDCMVRQWQLDDIRDNLAAIRAQQEQLQLDAISRASDADRQERELRDLQLRQDMYRPR